MIYLLGFALLTTAPVSAAQSDYSTAETRALMHSYARCVVERQHARAADAILRNVANDTILRDYPSLVIGSCLARDVRQTTKMRFGGDLYRYALADALVSRDLLARPMPDFGNVARLAHRDPGPVPTQVTTKGKRLGKKQYDAALKQHQDAAAYAFLSRYGECVVRVAPANSRALLATVPDTPAEAAAFKALSPAFGNCLVEGQTLELGKVALRGTVAVNYYRLAHAPRLPAPAPGSAR